MREQAAKCIGIRHAVADTPGTAGPHGNASADDVLVLMALVKHMSVAGPATLKLRH